MYRWLVVLQPTSSSPLSLLIFSPLHFPVEPAISLQCLPLGIYSLFQRCDPASLPLTAAALQLHQSRTCTRTPTLSRSERRAETRCERHTRRNVCLLTVRSTRKAVKKSCGEFIIFNVPPVFKLRVTSIDLGASESWAL